MNIVMKLPALNEVENFLTRRAPASCF